MVDNKRKIDLQEAARAWLASLSSEKRLAIYQRFTAKYAFNDLAKQKEQASSQARKRFASFMGTMLLVCVMAGSSLVGITLDSWVFLVLGITAGVFLALYRKKAAEHFDRRLKNTWAKVKEHFKSPMSAGKVLRVILATALFTGLGYFAIMVYHSMYYSLNHLMAQAHLGVLGSVFGPLLALGLVVGVLTLTMTDTVQWMTNLPRIGEWLKFWFLGYAYKHGNIKANNSAQARVIRGIARSLSMAAGLVGFYFISIGAASGWMSGVNSFFSAGFSSPFSDITSIPMSILAAIVFYAGMCGVARLCIFLDHKVEGIAARGVRPMWGYFKDLKPAERLAAVREACLDLVSAAVTTDHVGVSLDVSSTFSIQEKLGSDHSVPAAKIAQSARREVGVDAGQFGKPLPAFVPAPQPAVDKESGHAAPAPAAVGA